MAKRNVIPLSVLIMIMFALTVLIAGGVAKPPKLTGLAPLRILTLMTWYLIILITNKNEIIAGLACTIS